MIDLKKALKEELEFMWGMRLFFIGFVLGGIVAIILCTNYK